MMIKRPKDDPFVIYRAGNRYLVFSPTNVDWFVTNYKGILILKKHYQNILLATNHSHGHSSSESFESAVGNENNRILKIITRWIENDQEKNKRVQFQSSKPELTTVYLNLTDECNLKCDYCFATERDYDNKNLTFDEFKQLVLDLNQLCRKSPNLVFTGGEPLTSGFALELGKFATREGNEVTLLTNGTLVNEENAKEIAEVFDFVKISLDATTAQVHDAQRGKGTFTIVTRAMDLLMKYKANLGLASTVTSKSKNEVPLIAQKYKQIVKFAPFFPKVGRGKENSELAISGIEYYEALTSEKSINPLGRTSIELNKMRGHKIRRCAMGNEQISIGANGNVYPCHLLHVKEFFSGNIREKSIAEIYNHSPILVRIRELTVDNVSGCNSCDFRYMCGGGCRGRAYWDSGSVYKAGNFCDYEINAILDGLFKSCGTISEQ